MLKKIKYSYLFYLITVVFVVLYGIANKIGSDLFEYLSLAGVFASITIAKLLRL